MIHANQWRFGMTTVDRNGIIGLGITRPVVHTALMAALRAHWILSYGSTIDPRQGGVGVQLRTHMFWVHDIADDMILNRNNAPKYMKLCLPLSKLQCLARYRLGALHLLGRTEHNTAVHQRHCPLCSSTRDTCKPIWRARMLARCGSPRPEDLLHFMLECPAYDHIREQSPTVFRLHALAPPVTRLHDAFDTADQQALVQCVWAMHLYRSHLLGLKYPHGASIQHQPTNYIPTDVSLWCRSDFGLVDESSLMMVAV